MTLFYMYLEQDYKNINKGGYSFESRFLKSVEIEDKSKVLKLIENDKFLNMFNDNINALSCIVGKNGAGKTTFLELLITNLLWGLEPNKLNEANLTLFFYTEKKGKYKFYLQSYRDFGSQWKIVLKDKNTMKDELQYINREKTPSRDYYSGAWGNITKTPIEYNMIFHNLSPFDNIYTLLKKKLSESEKQRKYYLNRFRYIGVNNIEKDRPKYEYFSTVNLITLFFDERFKKVLTELKYSFTSIEIEINRELFHNYYSETIDSGTKTVLLFVNNCIDEILYELFLTDEFDIKSNFKIDIFKKLFFLSSLDYLSEDINNFITMFVKKIELNDNSCESLKMIDIDDEIFNLENKFYMKNKIIFLNFIKKITIEDLIGMSNLGKKDFIEKNHENKDEIVKILKNIKRFTNYNYFSFEINILKPENDRSINYFQLSSGEKSYLTLFCNVVSMINELLSIQSTLEEYNDKERTFLIIFDEVELHLHPEWQRKFIYFINEFFKTKLDYVKFQFLIATHSPFIVSDLDNSQIIYLGNEKNKLKTFGGNIFDIFKRDFYVENSIGAFSESIIRELSTCLYFLSTCKMAYENNYFPLRDYINEPYKNRENKELENRELKKALEEFILKRIDENNYFSEISENEYFISFLKDRDNFFKKSEIIIDRLGDEVIKVHLERLLIEVKLFKVNENE